METTQSVGDAVRGLGEKENMWRGQAVYKQPTKLQVWRTPFLRAEVGKAGKKGAHLLDGVADGLELREGGWVRVDRWVRGGRTCPGYMASWSLRVSSRATAGTAAGEIQGSKQVPGDQGRLGRKWSMCFFFKRRLTCLLPDSGIAGG